MASRRITYGVKYPSLEDVIELVEIFGRWLSGNVIENESAFDDLVHRIDAEAMTGDLPAVLRIMHRLSQERNMPSDAIIELETRIVDMDDILEEKAKELKDRKKQLAKVKEYLSQYTPEYFNRKYESAIQRRDSLLEENEDLLDELKYKLKKARRKYGSASKEALELESALANVKEAISNPVEKFKRKYIPLREEIEEKGRQYLRVNNDYKAMRGQYKSMKANLAEEKAKFRKVHEARANEWRDKFLAGWKEAFQKLGAAMRWPQVIIDTYGDPRQNPESFTKGLLADIKKVYESDMFATDTEMALDKRDREALRNKAGAEAQRYRDLSKKLTGQDKQDLKSFDDRLVSEAVQTVNSFSNLPMYTLTTEIDFGQSGDTRRNRKHHTMQVSRYGYFHFIIKAQEAYNAYRNYIVRQVPISRGMRDRLRDALVDLSNLLTEYERRIRSINMVQKTAMYGETVIDTFESMSVETLQDVLAATISQLENEEPDIDNFAKAYIDDKTPGYMGQQTDDLRCLFYNPFLLAPVYYFFGVAGSKHKEVNKTHYWLKIENSECEDMDCIPCALTIRTPDIVNVTDDEIAAVRSNIADMDAKDLSDTTAYSQILAPLTKPWIIVKSISQLGTWEVYKCSTPELANIKPLEFRSKMQDIIGLIVKQGHMMRITGFSDYEGAGWEYDLEAFAVTAKVEHNTGMGNSLLKLLRGNQHLLDYGGCCIGETTYAYLLEFAGKMKTFNPLVMLTSRDIIPSMVHDSMVMAENGMNLGPGEIDGEFFDSVPIKKLTEEECVKKAESEWDIRHNAQRALVPEDFVIWEMLRLPRWIIVNKLDKNTNTWEVEDCSDYTLNTVSPLDALALMNNLIVFTKKAAKEGHKQSNTLHRIIDYFIAVPKEDETEDRYKSLYNLVGVCNSAGLIATIRDRMPMSKDEEPLISQDEFIEASMCDNVLDQLKCFKNIRYIVINDVKTTTGGRVKDYESVAVQGHVTGKDLSKGANDLLRIWQDPNKACWLIVDSRWYNIEKAMRALYKELPTIYIGADYETLNKVSETNPSLLGWARMDNEKAAITTGCFKGTTCTRQFLDMVAKYAVEGFSVYVITFHGAFFDMHMFLEGVATYGEFGQYDTDRVIVVGNKLLEIDWLKKVKFIDLRRFTQNSLAGISEAFHVANPKSKIDLQKVQELYEAGNCNMETFWINLRKLSSSDLTQDVDADHKMPEFQEKIKNMNGEEVYTEYCINDAVATVQCYHKVKKACLDMVRSMGPDNELAKELEPKYNIDDYCTIPSLAYGTYRAGLPVREKTKIKPPVAETLQIHTSIKASGVGGRSEIYDFVPPTIIQENHQVFDVTSLFPFAAMAGHMPRGELHLVAAIDDPVSKKYEEENANVAHMNLPIANKLGDYYCTITEQPDYIVIPHAEPGYPLDWKCRKPFSRWVPVVMLRLHLYFGGKAIVHYGHYWEEMEDHYFDGSLRFWKEVKMRQDYLKSLLPTISDEDLSVDMPMLEKMIEEHHPKLTWAFEDGVLLRTKIDKVLDEYNPMVRWMAKMLSNSLLGRTSKRLREYETLIMNGASPVQKFIETHQDRKYVIHHLSKNVDENRSVVAQIAAPYSKCSMITADINQEDLFASGDKKRETTKVPEACISVTMFSYTHFHMSMAMRRFYAAKSLRGIETDGIHGNPQQYVEWCERQGIQNPFWIDGPLKNIIPGSVLDDDIFKPTPGDRRSEAELPLIGSFYCPSAANRYAAAHSLPQVPKAGDYGYFTEELRDLGMYDVFYPFCKFYYYRCLADGREYIKAKGLSVRMSKNGHDYIVLENSDEYKQMCDEVTSSSMFEKNAKSMRQMKALQLCMNASKPLVSRKLFENIAAGIGSDAVDFRFQGRLSKLNATKIHTAELVDGTNTHETPIHYTLCTKRIEPHRAYRVYYEGEQLMRNGIPISDDDRRDIELAISRIIRNRDAIAKRGMTVEIAGLPAYVSNKMIIAMKNNLIARVIKSRSISQ